MKNHAKNAWHNVAGITPEELKHAEEETMKRYGDIIDCPRPSSSRKRNSINSRAAQFAPFAALTGFEEEIRTESRYTEERHELSESEQEAMDEVLQAIETTIEAFPEVTYSVFEPDPEKAGGFYREYTKRVKKIDGLKKQLVFTDRTKADFADIREMRLTESKT